MNRILDLLLMIAIAVVFLAGCPTKVCAPGTTQACVCAGGSQGVQTCNDNGKKWGECEGCKQTKTAQEESFPVKSVEELLQRYKDKDRNFTGSELPSANLRNAKLSYIKLIKSNLSGANLSGADLYQANFRDANLAGANLRAASLWMAYIKNADLTGADLRRADLRDVNLRAAKISDAKLRGARYDTGTTFPRGFDAKAQGLVKR
jgi:hypothetical protein